MGRVASTIAALGTGIRDGDVGFLRVTQGGETELVRLTWDLPAARWISTALPSGNMGNDPKEMLPLSVGGWSYLGSQDTANSGIALRAGCIPFAGALVAAGLKLQDRLLGRFASINANPQFYVAPWFFEYDNGDDVVYDNDVGAQGGKTWNGSPDIGFQPSSLNLGHGATLSTNSTVQGLFVTADSYGDALGGYSGLTRGLGWDDVKFFLSSVPSGSALGGVPTTTVTAPSKKYLYPTFYGSQSISSGKVAALAYEVRWVSA